MVEHCVEVRIRMNFDLISYLFMATKCCAPQIFLHPSHIYQFWVSSNNRIKLPPLLVQSNKGLHKHSCVLPVHLSEQPLNKPAIFHDFFVLPNFSTM